MRGVDCEERTGAWVRCRGGEAWRAEGHEAKGDAPGAVAAGVVRAAVAAVRPAAEAQVGVHAVAAVRRGAPSRRGRGRIDGEDSFGRRAHECARAQKEVAHAAPRLDGRKLEASEHFGLDRRALRGGGDGVKWGCGKWYA